MKYLIITLTIIGLSINNFCFGQKINTLTKKEQDEGWQLLFDGKSLNGWKGFNSESVGSAWSVKNGLLILDKSNKAIGGDIETVEEFENFEFSIDWMIEKCGNSGIMFNVVDDGKHKNPWQTGPEMQILDNTCHPDSKIKKHRAGNLYDLIESKTESVKPHDQWNTAKISSNNGHLVFWLNDVKQLEVDMFTPEWWEMIQGSKFKEMPDFGKARKGRIDLQDHDFVVSFRNIKIRKL